MGNIFRLVHKICLTEKDAVRTVKGLKNSGDVTNPFYKPSQKTGRFLVFLYETKSRSRAEEGITYYRQKGLFCAIHADSLDDGDA